MHRTIKCIGVAVLLLTLLVGASSCSGSGAEGGGNGGEDGGGGSTAEPDGGGGGSTDGGGGGGGVGGDASPGGGPVSVPTNSPVTVAARAADGSVSGTYTDPRTQQSFSFSVRATSATAAVASYTLDTLAIHVNLSGPSTAAITMTESGDDLGASLTGNGPKPTDFTSQFILSTLESIFASAIRAIPLELNCGQGFTPVEVAALLVPWQVIYKYELSASTRVPDVRAAADAASCATFAFAGASSTQPTRPITKPSGAGLVNLGNDDPIPTVLGFFPLDRVGSKDPALQKVLPFSAIDTTYGSCDSMCRGACGADCEPNNCKTTTGLSRCEVDAAGANTCYKLVYTDYVCGTHPACVAHDACYDNCNKEWGCGTLDAAFCMHTMGHPMGFTSCDQHVLDEYGASTGADWARGYGPYTGSQTYRYLASREYDGTACPCLHECVPNSTPVATADGRSVPIERVHVGDTIATIDPSVDDPSGDLASARVEKVLVHRDGPFMLDRLESSSGTELLVTPNHPVWTVELGYVPAADLVVGAHLMELDPATGRGRPEMLVSIVRAFSTTDVVYNLKTSRSSYVAAGILVHNKCLARGSLIDTPEGAVPIENVRPGDRVYGQLDGWRAATRVLRTYEKTTILSRLPGRRLAPHVLVTDNHRVVTPDGERRASTLPAPAEDVCGAVYDLATESGNYWAEGVLLRATPE